MIFDTAPKVGFLIPPEISAMTILGRFIPQLFRVLNKLTNAYKPMEYSRVGGKSKLCWTHLYCKNRITVDKMQKRKQNHGWI